MLGGFLGKHVTDLRVSDVNMYALSIFSICCRIQKGSYKQTKHNNGAVIQV